MNAPACERCGEPVLEGEQEPPCVNAHIHYECAVRTAVGSIGHQLHKCSCYGGTEEDPPDMTKRQAAKAALELAFLLRDEVTWTDTP